MARLHFKRNLITGLLTIIPLWVTSAVFIFILGLLVSLGEPIMSGLVRALALVAPSAAAALDHRWLLSALALLLTLIVLYVIGWLTQRVIGQRLFQAFDTLLARIPLVQTIYGGTKKLMTVLQTKPSGVQRVVLIDFPRRGMKVLGLVTRLMREEGTDREMAAVFIPTTPNPTGGYLEIVPLEEITPTDWTVDQAMAFIISGGAVAPDTLPASTPRGRDTARTGTDAQHDPDGDP